MVIAEKVFGLKTIGFELSPIFWLVTKIHLLIKGTKQSQVYCRNFYNQDLSDADIVFCFLSIHAMERLRPKFEKELKTGAKIISYSFAIHGWEPKEVIEGYPDKVFLYEV